MSDIEIARTIFGLEVARVPSALLRPLRLSDLSGLYQVLSERADMTWERVPATLPYTKHLLDFRLEHYVEYGFGVYAVVDENDEIIGQAGLQVLDGGRDRVEVVVFMAAHLVGRGIGAAVMSDLVRMCADAGMTRIFATVRDENERALRLMQRLEFQTLGSYVHYEQPCVLLEKVLNRHEEGTVSSPPGRD